MGHQYTPQGTLNLKTGEFTRTGVNWSQIKNYGADIFLLNPAILGTGFLLWKNQQD
jgi:hypothetical protein